jgi:putative ABC transport system permease protein
MMHPLLRFALWTCPSDYRREYGRSIEYDIRDRRITLASATLDLLWQGVLMRLESAFRDGTFALRTLAKTPMYTIVATLAIALAIAGNVAVGSVLEGVLLRPLPYANADRLVYVDADVGYGQFSYLDGRDFANRQHTLERFGMRAARSRVLSGEGHPVTLNGSAVDGGYFGVIGAHPQLGRLLTAGDLGRKNVVISDDTWRKYFGGDPAVVGRSVTLDGVHYTVVGVASRDLRDISQQGLASRAFWLPMDPRGNVESQRGYTDYDGWAILKPGVTVQAASADANRSMTAIVRQHPEAHTTWKRAQVTSAFDLIVGPVRQMLWLLYAAVTILLIIACANIVNLTLVRAAARERELVVRTALGASRARIAAQLCVEMGILAVTGGIAGVALGWAGLRLFDAIGPQMVPRWEGVHIDGTMIAYVVFLLAVTTLVTGIVPAFAQRRDLVAGLKAAGRSGDLSGAKRLRVSLVVAEIALTLGLVASAGLVVRSFVTLTHVKLGFDSRHLYTIEIPNLQKTKYPTYDTELRGVDRLVAAVQSIPGVREAASTTVVPFKGGFIVGTTIPGRPGSEEVDGNAVAPSYFRVMHIPLLRGREFTRRDGPHAPSVTIVNASLAKHYFGTLDVIGKHITPGVSSSNTPSKTRTIVGVVSDTRDGFNEPMKPEFYLPDSQLQIYGQIVARTSGQDEGFARSVGRAFTSVDSSLPAPEIVSYDTLFAQNSGRWQAAALLFSVLAFLALMLALAGIYAVSAYSVQQRTQEFGIRKAIGAKDAHVLGTVISDALRQGAVGIAIGLVLAALCTRLLSSLLFQTSPLDPLTYIAVIVLLIGCTVLAALMPALRATRVQPALALRYE